MATHNIFPSRLTASTVCESGAPAISTRCSIASDTVVVQPQYSKQRRQQQKEQQAQPKQQHEDECGKPPFPLPTEVIRLSEQRRIQPLDGGAVGVGDGASWRETTFHRSRHDNNDFRRNRNNNDNQDENDKIEDDNDEDWQKHFDGFMVHPPFERRASGGGAAVAQVRPPRVVDLPTPQATLLLNLGAKLRTIIQQHTNNNNGDYNNNNDGDQNGGCRRFSHIGDGAPKLPDRRKSHHGREPRKARNYRAVSLTGNEAALPPPVPAESDSGGAGPSDYALRSGGDVRRASSAAPPLAKRANDGANHEEASRSFPSGAADGAGGGFLSALNALKSSYRRNRLRNRPADADGGGSVSRCATIDAVESEFDSLLFDDDDQGPTAESTAADGVAANFRSRALSSGAVGLARVPAITAATVEMSRQQKQQRRAEHQGRTNSEKRRATRRRQTLYEDKR